MTKTFNRRVKTRLETKNFLSYEAKKLIDIIAVLAAPTEDGNEFAGVPKTFRRQ